MPLSLSNIFLIFYICFIIFLLVYFYTIKCEKSLNLSLNYDLYYSSNVIDVCVNSDEINEIKCNNMILLQIEDLLYDNKVVKYKVYRK